MEEIKFYNSIYDKRVVFNLIVTGSKYQKVLDCIINNKYDHLFQNICIYCFNKEKYINIMKKNNKVKGVYNEPEDVIKFIDNVSSAEIKEYPIVKIISLF